MDKKMYEFFKSKGYSEDDITMTEIELEIGMPLPNEVRKDYFEYLKTTYKE